MDWEGIDWAALERLRQGFLDGTSRRSDYWRSRRDLEAYDRTFAQRIGWKWDFVLAELAARGWLPPEGDVLDWGCGSGIAGRAFLGYFGAAAAQRAPGGLALWDRSSLAMAFAAERARAAFPSVAVRIAGGEEAAPTVLLSHVLTELPDAHLDRLLAMLNKATAVIWVEPGTYDASRRLIAIRERLRGAFQLVAPCTHQAACGLLTPENQRHWCHHFATTPTEVFMDGDWARFARIAGVDLRSLPVSFLVLGKRPAPAFAGELTTFRVVGRPRVYKGYALIMGCDAGGVRDYRLAKSRLGDEFRRVKRGDCDSLQAWRVEDGEIVEQQRDSGSEIRDSWKQQQL
jgi:hypothetical protein